MMSVLPCRALEHRLGKSAVPRISPLRPPSPTYEAQTDGPLQGDNAWETPFFQSEMQHLKALSSARHHVVGMDLSYMRHLFWQISSQLLQLVWTGLSQL